PHALSSPAPGIAPPVLSSPTRRSSDLRSSARSPACLYRRAASSAVRRGHAARGRGLARGVFLALAQGIPDSRRSRPVGGDASVADRKRPRLDSSHGSSSYSVARLTEDA